MNLGGGEKKMVTIVRGGPGNASRDGVGFSCWSGRYSVVYPKPTDLFMVWDDRRDLREEYGIADASEAVPFLSKESYWGYGYWRRGGGFRLAHATDSLTSSIREGYLSIDNQEATAESVVPAGPHLITACPTNAVTTNGGIGGKPGADFWTPYALGELIWYTNGLSRAQHRYIAAKLCKKWFGTAGVTNAATVGSVTLANGATLTLANAPGADGKVISCASLAGDGTVAADRVDDIASLAFSFQSRTEVDQIAVDGTATFADDVTVTLTVPAGVRPAAGEYILFSADSLENVDLARWTLNVANPRNRGYRLKRDGEAIVLCVTTPGMSILIQ